MKGPAVKKEWKRLRRVEKVAAKEGERERIPLLDYLKTLSQPLTAGTRLSVTGVAAARHTLIQIPDTPADPTRRFRHTGRFCMTLRDFVTILDLSDISRIDRLCKVKLDGKCAVPYESRDIVETIYFDKLLEMIAAFRTKHPKSGRRAIDAPKVTKKERGLSIVPEEYPVMPILRSSVGIPVHGAENRARAQELSTDDPDKDKRRVKQLMDAPASGRWMRLLQRSWQRLQW